MKIKERPHNINKKQKDNDKSKREDIIITKIDECSAIVIVAFKDFRKEAERQLNITENCGKPQEDPTATNMKLVNDTIERFKWYSHTSETHMIFWKIWQSKREKKEPEESLLVIIDVNSLYENIPNNEGIKTVKEGYRK